MGFLNNDDDDDDAGIAIGHCKDSVLFHIINHMDSYLITETCIFMILAIIKVLKLDFQGVHRDACRL